MEIMRRDKKVDEIEFKTKGRDNMILDNKKE